MACRRLSLWSLLVYWGDVWNAPELIAAAELQELKACHILSLLNARWVDGPNAVECRTARCTLSQVCQGRLGVDDSGRNANGDPV